MSTIREQEKRLVIGGAEVTYFEAGRGTGGDRLPLVLVHGTAGKTENHFGYLFPMLAMRQHVVSIDLAQPVSDEGSGLSVEALVEQVAGVLDQALPGRQVTLLGYSLGAVVAAAAAARRPETVRNLVLIAGWMKTDTQQKLRNRIWRTLRDADSSVLRQYMAFCAFSGRFMAERSLEEMVVISDAIVIDDFVDAQMALNANIDISGLVPSISATTLVVGCTHDQMVPASHAKALFGGIEDARYAEIESGHAVVFERPAELFRLVDNFTKSPRFHAAGTLIAPHRP